MRRRSRYGRVEDERGSLGPMASAPFLIPAHRTGRADLSAALQSERIGERGWRRGRAPIPLVNLNEWLKLRHALTPSRRRGPAPTALTGCTALQDGWHGDERAAIRHPQVERRA